MKLKKTISILICAALFWSCEETQELSLKNNEETLLVVEGLITNENKRHEVILSQTFTDLGQAPPPVNDALVVLIEGETNHILSRDPDRPGVYLTDSLRAVISRLYTLYILHQGTEYAAFSIANFGAPLDPLIVNEFEDGQFEFIYQESNQPSMLEVVINWDEFDESGTLQNREIRAFYYTLNVIDVNQIFAPDKERIIFPSGASVFRRKFSLTEDHQEFLRSFLSEVDWRGGPFDVAPGNVRTNLSEGAVGYFAVSMVQTDSTVIN